jgi:sugar-phosphatase
MLQGVTHPTLPDRPFAAFLFDMDGTLLSSLASAERVWSAWARRHGLDVDAFLPTIHGRQAVETIRDLGLPGLDPEAEARWVLDREKEDLGDIAPVAGAARFLARLPADRWCIVTSAPRDLALCRLAAAGLAPSRLMVTAEDATRGKPAPDAYLLAARQLGVAARDCLVFEDAPAGIAAAEAAGADVLVITAVHREQIATTHATARDYESLDVRVDPAGLVVGRQVSA